jgi:hypothetical protein
VASYLPAPGTIPAYVNPPRAPETAAAATTASATTPSTTPAATTSSSGESFLSKLSRSVGLRGNDAAEPASQPASKAAATAKAKTEATKSSKDAKAVAAKSEVQKSSTAGSEKAAAPRVVPLDRTQQASTKDVPSPAPSASPSQAIAGAQPTVPSNSFDSRWSSFR